MSDSEEQSDGIWEQIRKRLLELESNLGSRQDHTAAVSTRLARRAAAFRERIEKPREFGVDQPYLFFSTNRSKYALDLEAVVEIQALDSFSPVPGVPPFVYGVIPYREQILALLDLRRLFGAVESGIADIHFHIVAEAGGYRVAIAAGDVEDLVALPASAIQPAPGWGGSTPGEWIRGIYQADRLILQLDSILGNTALLTWRDQTVSQS